MKYIYKQNVGVCMYTYSRVQKYFKANVIYVWMHAWNISYDLAPPPPPQQRKPYFLYKEKKPNIEGRKAFVSVSGGRWRGEGLEPKRRHEKIRKCEMCFFFTEAFLCSIFSHKNQQDLRIWLFTHLF
jgi:hypothetical protein